MSEGARGPAAHAGVARNGAEGAQWERHASREEADAAAARIKIPAKIAAERRRARSGPTGSRHRQARLAIAQARRKAGPRQQQQSEQSGRRTAAAALPWPTGGPRRGRGRRERGSRSPGNELPAERERGRGGSSPARSSRPGTSPRSPRRAPPRISSMTSQDRGGDEHAGSPRRRRRTRPAPRSRAQPSTKPSSAAISGRSDPKAPSASHDDWKMAGESGRATPKTTRRGAAPSPTVTGIERKNADGPASTWRVVSTSAPRKPPGRVFRRIASPRRPALDDGRRRRRAIPCPPSSQTLPQSSIEPRGF